VNGQELTPWEREYGIFEGRKGRGGGMNRREEERGKKRKKERRGGGQE
jgi:hypothetical protein